MASPKLGKGLIFITLIIVICNAQIVVAAEIDVVIGRIAIVIDVEFFGQLGVCRLVSLGLLNFFLGNRLLRLQHRLLMPGMAAFDASDGIILAKIVKARAALRAAMLGAPFWLDHEIPSCWLSAPSGEPVKTFALMVIAPTGIKRGARLAIACARCQKPRPPLHQIETLP